MRLQFLRVLRGRAHFPYFWASSPCFLPASFACEALSRQSSTALLQSSPAVLADGSGVVNFSPTSMMHGGTASVQAFKHTFAAAPSPHAISKTLDAQQAFSESWRWHAATVRP